MIYNDFKGLKLSALGIGAMRLPTVGKDANNVDVEETGKMVSYAIDHGVNYFDTAYEYHGGKSETVLGDLLSAYDRDSFYLADKFPGYNLTYIDKVKTIFEEQLKRCRVDYFDFYLLHNVYEKNIGPYMDKKYGVIDHLLEQRENGRIKHLGFSCHGRYDILKEMLDRYGSELEFCQLQINYLDWTFQDAKAKAELVSEYGLPIWVMEPLRGGQLAKLPDTAAARLKELRPDEGIPSWAFRFAQSLDDVTVTLAGSSNLEQLQENVAAFENNRPLSGSEKETLFSIAEDMLKEGVLPCTACRYCTGHCPQGLDIPLLLSLYNEHSFTGGGFIAPMAVGALPADKRPDACTGCGSCEEVCPQQIKIPEAMKDFVDKLKNNSFSV